MTTKVTYSGPLVDWWNMAHPGQAFPDPEQNPEMFSGYNLNIVTNQYFGEPSCANGMICQHGFLDYACQIQNSCYLNLLWFGCVVLALMIILYMIIWLIALLCKHSDKLKFIVSPFMQACCCISGAVKGMNCDIFRKRIAKNIRRKQQVKIQKLKEKMKKLGMSIDFQTLDKQKREQIIKVVQQYQIVQQQT